MRAAPWLATSVPSAVMAVPAMLSREERQYLIWLTSSAYQGWGEVVDLGPWLGGSTAALAEGLRRRGKGGMVRSLDLFRWEPDYMGSVAAEPLEEGADFQHVFARHTAPWASLIEARQADLTRYHWDGGPIELLFVDAAKTWELTNAILAGFGDHLVPGRSRVVLQDFRYHETHWLPLIFDSQPALWQEIEAVRDGWTVTFRPLQPLRSPDQPHRTWSEADFPLQVAEPLLRRRMATEHPDNAPLFLRMLYRRVLVEGAAEEAAKLRRQLLSTGIDSRELARIEDVASSLVPVGWQAYDRGDFRKALALADRAIGGRIPAPTWGLALRGMSLLKLGELDAARPCIEEVQRRSPDLPDPLLYRAELELAAGAPQAAERHALDALALASDVAEPWLHWAVSLLARGWSHESPHQRHAQIVAELRARFGARPSLDALLPHSSGGGPGTGEARTAALSAGWQAFEQGDYPGAARTALDLLKTGEAGRPWAQALLGMAHLRMGEVEIAGPLLEEVVAALPDAADVWMYLAELALVQDQLGLAEDRVRRSLELARAWPDNMLHWALSMLAWIWSLEAPRRSHAELLRRLDERFTDRLPLRLLHAHEALLHERRDVALQILDEVQTRDPGNEAARELRALATGSGVAPDGG